MKYFSHMSNEEENFFSSFSLDFEETDELKDAFIKLYLPDTIKDLAKTDILDLTATFPLPEVPSEILKKVFPAIEERQETYSFNEGGVKVTLVANKHPYQSYFKVESHSNYIPKEPLLYREGLDTLQGDQIKARCLNISEEEFQESVINLPCEYPFTSIAEWVIEEVTRASEILEKDSPTVWDPSLSTDPNEFDTVLTFAIQHRDILRIKENNVEAKQRVRNDLKEFVDSFVDAVKNKGLTKRLHKETISYVLAINGENKIVLHLSFYGVP